MAPRARGSDGRVHFLRDFDFIPPLRPSVTIAYKAGSVLTVTRDCASTAIACGAAEKVNATARRG